MRDTPMIPGSGETCATCSFWRRDRRGDSGAWGQCRRLPPTLPEIEPDKLVHVGVWPHTEERDWCGEWRAVTAAPDGVSG